MSLIDKLKSINAVKILHAEKAENGFEGPMFDIRPDWLRQAIASKKIKLYTSRCLDYAAFSIENEYGESIVFYPGDWIIHDTNGKIYGVEAEVIRILNGEL